MVLDFASCRGWPAVWLETLVGVMDPAIAVYRRNGFEVADHRPPTLLLDGVVVMQHTVACHVRSA